MRDAGATSAATAKSLAELGCRDSLIRRQLVARGVLVETGAEKLYLDEQECGAFMRRRLTFALGLLAMIVLTVAVALAWGRSS